jgi:hypothetical protein
MGASSAGSYEVTPPGRSRASDAAHRADRSTQRQQPTRQAYGESDPTGDAIPILTGLRRAACGRSETVAVATSTGMAERAMASVSRARVDA